MSPPRRLENKKINDTEVLKDIFNFYRDYKFVSEYSIIPSKKLNILLIGNHSSGKSSFVNWYFKAPVMKTNVALETDKFCVVTSNQTECYDSESEKTMEIRNYLRDATIRMFPHLSGIEELGNGGEFLESKVVCGNEILPMTRKVTLIDSPGLIDGSLGSTLDMNEIIQFLGDRVDLIFVFLDPWIKATCSRTMEVVENIHKRNPSKLHFFFSKADEVPNEEERHQVLIQIAQSLSGRIGNKKFDLLPIYIPQEDEKKGYIKITRRNLFNEEIPNQINQINSICELKMQYKIQNSLQKMIQDCEKAQAELKKQISIQEDHKRKNNQKRKRKRILLLLSSIFPMLMISYFGNRWLITRYEDRYPAFISNFVKTTIQSIEETKVTHQIYVFIALCCFSLICYHLGKWFTPVAEPFPRSIEDLQLIHAKINEIALPKAKEMYAKYLVLESDDE